MSEEEKKEAAVEEKPTPEEITPESIAVSEDTSVEEARKEAGEESVIPMETDTEEVTVLPHRDLRSGMTVRVHERIIDVNSKGEEKERIQMFEGLLIAVRGAGLSRTMTVRKNAKGWMVEKIYPLASPNLDKVEVVKQFRTRRAKLTYLRTRFRRKLREIKTK